MSSNLDYTNMLWENQKLIRYKSLSEFNENTNIGKNIAVLQSLNLNYSVIGKKSSKNCEAEISMEQGEIDRIQLKTDCKNFGEIIDSKGRIKIDISESFEVKDSLKDNDTDSLKIEINDNKLVKQPLPDSDNINLEILDFSICEKDSNSKDKKKEEIVSKEDIFTNLIKKQVTIELMNKPTQKVKSSNYITHTVMKVPKTIKLGSNSANIMKKPNVLKDKILLNHSQKSSNNINTTAKTNQIEASSLLYSYKLKKETEHYTKIKQSIKDSTIKSKFRKSRVNVNAHSLTSMQQTNNNINNKPNSNNDSCVTGKKYNLLDSITKSSCYDTFTITPSIFSSHTTFKRSSKTILKQAIKSNNVSMNLKEKN